MVGIRPAGSRAGGPTALEPATAARGSPPAAPIAPARRQHVSRASSSRTAAELASSCATGMPERRRGTAQWTLPRWPFARQRSRHTTMPVALLEQSTHRNSQRPSQLDQIPQRWIAPSDLNTAKVGAVHASLLRKTFLRPALSSPQGANAKGQLMHDLIFGLQAAIIGVCILLVYRI